MHIHPLLLWLFCAYAAPHTPVQKNKDDLEVSWSLWNKSIHSFNTSSYVYKLQIDCDGSDDCTPCQQAPKYVVIEDRSQNIQYTDEDTQSECDTTSDAILSSCKTMNEWFKWIQALSHHDRAQYDDTYGFPTKIVDGTIINQIECVSFFKHNLILNNLGTKYCTDYIANDGVDELINSSLYSTECEPQIIENDDCTQWMYVYFTIALSITLSTLSVLCFWLYYRQGIKPATKGYKRGQSDGDDFAMDNSDIYKSNSVVKSKKEKKKKSKLLGIDENKVVSKIKIKKKRKGKYGSLVQSDEDEKFDNAFDFDSERSDEWNFVNDDSKQDKKQKQDVLGGNKSDQTDEENEKYSIPFSELQL